MNSKLSKPIKSNKKPRAFSYTLYDNRRGDNSINFCISAVGEDLEILKIIDHLIRSKQIKTSRSRLVMTACRAYYGELRSSGIKDFVLSLYTNGLLERPAGCNLFDQIIESEVRTHGLIKLRKMWKLNSSQFWSLIFLHINKLEDPDLPTARN